jgi:hypothetical protein
MPSPAMISVPGLADRPDVAAFQADVGFDDAPVIDDQGVRDDRIGDVRGNALPLAHAVANDFAAAKLDFFAVNREILFDLDHERRVGEAHAIARGWAEHFRIRLPGYLHGHATAPP